MKKNKFTLGWFFISLLMAFAVTACDDDDDDAVNVTFPEKQTIGGTVNDEKELTFDAVADWTLTSSTTWCYFITEETPVAKAAGTVKEYAISGKAGKQTVKIGISDEGQDYDNATVASITIRMNGQEAVLAEVTRNAAGRTFKLLKYAPKATEGEEEEVEYEWVEVSADEPIEVGYSDYIKYKAEANFPFAATNRPEWLDIEGEAIVGTAGQTVEFGIKVVENRPEFSKYVKAGAINFQAEDGKGLFTYKLNYNGMDPEAMEYEGPSQWNWEVSLDGNTIIQTSQGISGGEETSSYNKFVEFTIIARNDKFEPVFVEEYKDWQGNTCYQEVNNDEWSWMNVEVRDEKSGKIRVSVKKFDPESDYVEERIGYIFVFPKALYDKMQEDPKNYGVIIEGELDMETFTRPTSLREVYFQNYLLMNFIQKEQKQQGEDAESRFVVTYTDGNQEEQEVELTKVTEGDDFNAYAPLKDIYQITLPSGVTTLKCDPLMKEVYESEWIFDVLEGEGAFKNDEEHWIKISEDKKTISIYIGEEYEFDKKIYLVIKGTDYSFKKVLIITPNK